MNRRGFLGAILAAGVAPAVVRAASLMPVRALPSGVLTLGEWPTPIIAAANLSKMDARLLWPGVKAFWAQYYEDYPEVFK